MTTVAIDGVAALAGRWSRRAVGAASAPERENRMRAIVRHAALTADQEQRVRIAASALAANSIVAVASPWDGTRCDLVLVHGDDAYGQRVIEIARRRGVAVLALSAVRNGEDRGVHWLREDTSAALLARQMVTLLQDEAAPPSPPVTAAEASAPGSTAPLASDCALLRLADDPAHASQDVEARVGGRTAFLLRSTGRVLTATLSDQFGTRDRLCEAGWQFRPARKVDVDASRFEFAGSLEAYLLQGALHNARLLPAFPEQPCSLQDWPDLGTTPEAVNALRVVQALQMRALTPSMVAQECALEPAYVSACLWALAASGLLQRSAQAIPPAAAQATPAGRPRGILARLAAHFGLGRTG